MFKNFKSLLYIPLIGMFFTISSCSSSDDTKVENPTMESTIITKSTTNSKKIAIELLDFGVKAVNDTGSLITYSTYNDFYYRDQFVDFSNYSISYNSTSLKTNNSELVVDSLGNSYLRRNDNLVDINTIPVQDLIVEEFILVMTHLQQSGSNGDSYTYEEYEANSSDANGGCPFWKVRRAAGIGFTEAEAEADLWYATRSFIDSHQGCTSIGGVSHKSIGIGDFGFEMAIQSFCCP